MKQKQTKQKIDFQVEDEFQLSPQHNQQDGQNKIKDKKSISNVYAQLLNKKKAKQQNTQLADKELSKKEKKKDKKKIKMQKLKQQTQVKKEKKEAKKQEEKSSSAYKFINNKALEDELRKTTLKGVAKIFNLIASHKKQMEA